MNSLRLPWLETTRRRLLGASLGHAVLLQAAGEGGQFDLALALAASWLCEDDARPVVERPCGVCSGCKLFAARTHPDLLVLLPEALREPLGWSFDDESRSEKSKTKKPSKEIRVDEVRAATAYAATTAARGRGKVVLLHPAERMNDIAANAFLKTLEEPPGDARFVLCSGAADLLLPTIRSRCVAFAIEPAPAAEAEAWLRGQGVADAGVLLAAGGGQVDDAMGLAALGVDAAAWRKLPQRVARGDAGGFDGWPLPAAVEAMQKLCHDALRVAAGGEPRYFPTGSISAGPRLDALVAWSRELGRVAVDVEHPWQAPLAVEALVEEGRQALQTPRQRPTSRPAVPMG